MTEAWPVINAQGICYERKLEPGQDQHLIAGVVTREIQRKVTGCSAFSGEIQYPHLGLA
jgi:hypothetical protein